MKTAKRHKSFSVKNRSVERKKIYLLEINLFEKFRSVDLSFFFYEAATRANDDDDGDDVARAKRPERKNTYIVV